MNERDRDVALFRLSVLGPLASRAKLNRGELKTICRELASKKYLIPHSNRNSISAKTIERWYYLWLAGGFDALIPKKRSDHGRSRIAEAVQDRIVKLKKEAPSRSINTVMHLLQSEGIIARDSISRATLHRFMQKKNLSNHIASDSHTIERRCFEANHAGEIWHGDVMHGPTIPTPKGMKKTYLISFIDDASRIIAHSAFCFGETTLEIEGVLKQALLKRGIPHKIIFDNGPGYRSKTLQFICAKLEIRLVYCPAYEPQGKGKIERWHRTFREQFLSELSMEYIKNIDDLNARLWAWLAEIYHQKPHSGLSNKMTPIERWRHDLVHVRTLRTLTTHIDDYFYHRIKRLVRKDGTIAWQGLKFEVPYKLAGETVHIVIDPHQNQAVKVESLKGTYLGPVHPLDKHTNCHRKRQRPKKNPNGDNSDVHKKTSLVEMAYQKHQQQQIICDNKLDNEED